MPLAMTSDERKKLIEKIQEFRLIDDTFFHACFYDNKSCMEFVLRIILDKPQLKVIKMHTQEEIPNIYGRSVRFDVFAQDADGIQYNIEVQKNDDGADPRRARYNASLLDAMTVPSGTEWRQLPRTIIIFITENDVIGGGKPLYHVYRTIAEHGVSKMCDIMEKLVADRVLKIIINQLKRHVAYADIASDNETTVDEVIRIAKESGLAY